MKPRCRSCGEALVWATTHAGRPMPLDATPSAEPTNLKAWRGPDGTLHVRDIDGVPVLVRGQGELTEADTAALTEVVQAAKRKHEAEHG